MAKRAKENTELAQIEEKEKLNTLYTQLELNSEGEGSGGTSYEAIEKLLEFKKAIAEAIKTAGGKETDYNAETSTFEENIKGIVKEVTSSATAKPEDIAEGKTAWINGEEITGIKNSSDPNIINLGTNSSYNIKELYPDEYASLTINNFFMEVVSANISFGTYVASFPGTVNPKKSYDPSTGIYSVSNLTWSIGYTDNDRRHHDEYLTVSVNSYLILN